MAEGTLLQDKVFSRVSRFITPFMQWFKASTDAPLEFGQAAALYTLSTVALGRRWLTKSTNLHPNLFCMIVGDSSIARKSTSVRKSRALIDEIEPSRVGPTDYTIEGVYRWMQGKDHTTGKGRNKMALFAGEFGADLARMEAYGATVQADFCHLYDGEPIEKVRAGKGTIRIDKPRVNLFAAAAYPMLTRHLGPKDWFNGYLMRFLFVAPLTMRAEQLSEPPPRPQEYDKAKAALQLLRDDLVVGGHGMVLTPAAQKLYEQSVLFHRDQVTKKSHIITTYVARFWVNVLKLALLFQVDEDPNAPIGYDAMRLAVEFAMNVCWPSFMTTFEKTAVKDFESLSFMVAELVATAGGRGISRAEISRRFLGVRDLNEVLSSLKTGRLISTRISLNGDGAQDELLFWRH